EVGESVGGGGIEGERGVGDSLESRPLRERDGLRACHSESSDHSVAKTITVVEHENPMICHSAGCASRRRFAPYWSVKPARRVTRLVFVSRRRLSLPCTDPVAAPLERIRRQRAARPTL